MKKCKFDFMRLLFLPIWLIAALCVLSTAALIAVFVASWQQTFVAYAVYALSAYSLTALTLYCIKALPPFLKRLKSAFYRHPYGNKYMTDIGYRTRVSLYISLGINLSYSVFKLITGIVYSSVFIDAIAFYYIILTTIRFLLLRYMRKEKESTQNLIWEYKRFRLCAILMLALNLALTGVIVHMMASSRQYASNEIIIIASAVYTFYIVTASVVDFVKYRKHKSPVISAAKAIRFAAALVSLLSLETSMLAYYGDDEDFRILMTALTGAGVFIIMLVMSVHMIARAQREIKRLKSAPIEERNK